MKTPHIFASVCLILATTAAAVPPRAAVAEWNNFLATCGVFSTVAGNGGNASLSTSDWIPAFENGPATSCDLSNPHAVGADALGNIYIADKTSHSILKVTPDGLIHTWAGTHVAGTGTDALTLATNVALNQPNGLFVLPDGTAFVYDAGNHRIRKITPAGMMSTVVNDLDSRWTSSGRGLWVNQKKTVIYYTMEVKDTAGSGSLGGVVKKWTAGRGIHAITAYPATPSATNLEFRNPGNIDVNPITGKLYVTDRAESDATLTKSKVWRIDVEGVNGSACTKTRVAGNGNSAIPGGDGVLATATFLDQVRGISFLPNGAYFLATHQGGDIWYVDTYGYIHLFIQGRGTDDKHLGEGLNPPIVGADCISEPRSVTVAPSGSVLIVTNDTGYVRTVARSAPPAPEIKAFGWLPTDPTRWRLIWPSEVGRTYLVERCFDLEGPWDVRRIVTSSSIQTTFHETVPATESRVFYRLAPPR